MGRIRALLPLLDHLGQTLTFLRKSTAINVMSAAMPTETPPIITPAGAGPLTELEERDSDGEAKGIVEDDDIASCPIEATRGSVVVANIELAVGRVCDGREVGEPVGGGGGPCFAFIDPEGPGSGPG